MSNYGSSQSGNNSSSGQPSKLSRFITAYSNAVTNKEKRNIIENIKKLRIGRGDYTITYLQDQGITLTGDDIAFFRNDPNTSDNDMESQGGRRKRSTRRRSTRRSTRHKTRHGKKRSLRKMHRKHKSRRSNKSRKH